MIMITVIATIYKAP